MTVAPRFSPPTELIKVATANGKTIPVTLDPVLDRHLISPPLMAPQNEPKDFLRLPVSLDINLEAGFDIADISSPYHDITVERIDKDSARITLSEGEVPANKDFQLKWKAQASNAPQQALFTETIGQTRYLMTMMSPPLPEIPRQIKSHPREMLFIIDTSGSMGGTSIVQARKALKLGLNRLGPEDSFNITRFSNNYTQLFTAPRRASSENIREALNYVDNLHAGGGTMMYPVLDNSLSIQADKERLRQIIFITDGAIGNETQLFAAPRRASSENIREALNYVDNLYAGGGTMMYPALDNSLSIQADKERLRQIIFITDGAIGNETQLFALIKDKLDDARMFPVGIGSAPNRFFMSRAAKFGRGTMVMIGKLNEVETHMGQLFSDLENPVLTNLQLSLKDKGEAYPSRLPDLYDGCLLYTSPSPRDKRQSRMPSSA